MKPTFPGTRQLRQSLVCSLMLTAPWTVNSSFAAESGSTSVDPDVISRLLKRLDEQDDKIRKQDAKIQSQDAQINDLTAKLSSANVGSSVVTPPPAPTYPNLQFHGFGDFDYQAANRSGNYNPVGGPVNFQGLPAGRTSGSYNAFILGEFDLFLSSQLAEDISVLTETVIAAGTDNHFGVDVERLELQWHPADYFNVDAGRFHTALGYYNSAFHHGTWFQTAVGRPSFLQFEDSGGLLPVHTVGLSVHGAIPSGTLGLGYFVEVGNGRDYNTGGYNPVQNIIDNNNFKAENFELVAKPDWFTGGQLGVGVYHDLITPDKSAGDADKFPTTDELIPNASVAFHNTAWEVIAEAYLVRHAPDGGSVHYSPMWFAQIGRKFGLFTPYARFTYINASRNDVIYTTILNQAGLHYGPSIGLRYDCSTYVALKAQYDYLKDSGLPDGHELTLQAAFTF